MIIRIKKAEKFLKKSKGVIHIGASRGQEARVYKAFHRSVVWIEPIPEVFEKLLENIKHYRRQVAFRYLVTGDNKEYKFYITDNKGESSSILKFKDHNKLWPDIKQVKTIKLKGITLPNLIRKEKINLKNYDSLVLDTQGSELLILKGAR